MGAVGQRRGVGADHIESSWVGAAGSLGRLRKPKSTRIRNLEKIRQKGLGKTNLKDTLLTYEVSCANFMRLTTYPVKVSFPTVEFAMTKCPPLSVLATIPPSMVCLFILYLACGCVLADDENRFWKDDRGREITAKMVGKNGDNVELQLKDGRRVSFPLAKLSEVDRAVASQWEPPEEPATDENADQKAKPNFDSEWPERISLDADPEVNIVSEDPENKLFIYESPNFRFVTDFRLSKSVVSSFARNFETTYLFCRSLPVGLNRAVKTDGKYLIKSFESVEDYIAAGGQPIFDGMFLPSREMVVTSTKGLGVKKVGSGYMRDRDAFSKVIPHEIVHQMTPFSYYTSGTLGWFTEGVAEYVAITPYRSGSYNVRANLPEIIEYVTAHGSDKLSGRVLGREIEMPPLEKWMLQTYEEFGANTQFNYGTALLITTYFFQMDRDGDAARIRKFLSAVHDGKEGSEALKVFLDGDTFESLQDQITRAFKRERLDLKFSNSAKIGGSGAKDE